MQQQTDPRSELEQAQADERHWRFDRFDAADAWALGCELRNQAAAAGAAVTIEIRVARETVFFHAMPGTNASNADWARRKRNLVELVGRSSWSIGLAQLVDGSDILLKMGLPARDYAPHGGSFPLRDTRGSLLGVATVSGLPQRDDHRLLLSALAALSARP